jgi:hypothetical protein
VLSKAGPHGFRLTIDLRAPNAGTVPFSWPMMDFEQEIARMHGCKVFATLDLTQGFWQLPLHEDSLEAMSFVTPSAIWTPTRVPHGTKNAVPHIQSILTEILEEVVRKAIWLDDVLLYNQDEMMLLRIANNDGSFLALRTQAQPDQM